MTFIEAVNLRVDRAVEAPCYLCGNSSHHWHHIIGGSGKRKSCETPFSRIYLCYRCHDLIHADYTLNKGLRLQLQGLYFSQGKDEQEVRKLMGGKIYG
jgi:hypothetical protein